MKRFARALVVVLGLAVIGSVVSLVPQKNAAADGGAPVNIISPLPLPVTGNVNANITNSSAIPVSFNGTAQPVSLSSLPTAPLVTRDADNPARHPFTTSCFLIVDAANSSSAHCETPAIPAGQEVVIETVSLVANADPANVALTANLESTASGARRNIFLNPFFDVGTHQPTSSLFLSAQSLRFFADPGTTLACVAATKGPNTSVGLTGACGFFGYFVSLP